MSEEIDQSWLQFLSEYARGHFPCDRPPNPPTLPTHTLTSFRESPHILPLFDPPVYSSHLLTLETARSIRLFYEKHGYLPPPPSQYEALRERTVETYDLERSDQVGNFYGATELLKAFFDDALCVTLSLYKGKLQIVKATTSNKDGFPLVEGTILTSETSLCSHCILRPDHGIVQVQSCDDDWRFKSNPYTISVLKSYVGIPIILPVDPSDPSSTTSSFFNTSPSAPFDPSKFVAVGVLNIAWEKERGGPLTAQQIKVIENVRAMLQSQISATWEGSRRTKEARMRRITTDFVERALLPNDSEVIEDMKSQSSAADRLVKSIAEVLEDTSAVALLEVKALRGTSARDGERDFAVLDSAGRETKVLASSSQDEVTKDFQQGGNELLEILAGLLKKRDREGKVVWHQSRKLSSLSRPSSTPISSSPTPLGSGLEPYLPANTQSHLVLPFFTARQPTLVLIVGSRRPETFGNSEVTFLQNLGMVISAKAMQQKLVEADRAKTTFLSSITHELRTPLHGLLSQFELMREALLASDTGDLVSQLDTAEACGISLQQILNDVLDFGKITNADACRSPNASRSSARSCIPSQDLPVVDLARLAVNAARTCSQRRNQWVEASSDDTSGDESAASSLAGSDNSHLSVKVTVEHDDRGEDGWKGRVDVSGFTRVLNNIIGNALKYTSRGSINVQLSVTGSTENGCSTVEMRISDTGRGMDATFKSRLFQPFTQADTFSPGAGLGLYITKALVDRMNGSMSVESTIGVGSTFSISIPVAFVLCRRASALNSTELQQKIVHSIAPSGSTHRPRSQSISPTGQSETSSSSSSSPSSPLTVDESETMSTSSESDETQLLTPPDTPPISSRSPSKTVPPNGHAFHQNQKSLLPEKLKEEEQEILRILVVDDNTISRRILMAMLKRQSNVKTNEAADGMEAVEVFKTFRPHLVWTDISMPKMDGITAACEMRKHEELVGGQKSHIVAITGLGSADETKKLDALLGQAMLNEWKVKGKDSIHSLREGVEQAQKRLIACHAD